MKIYTILPILALLFTLSSCATGNNASEERTIYADTAEEIRDEEGTDLELSHYLQRLSGVTVMGSRSNVRVRVRGAASFGGGDDPLYVVDGQTVGTDYNRVNGFLNVRDIEKIRVLKGSDASIYGVRGTNGVILIETRR